jgi:hypothetical protein
VASVNNGTSSFQWLLSTFEVKRDHVRGAITRARSPSRKPCSHVKCVQFLYPLSSPASIYTHHIIVPFMERSNHFGWKDIRERDKKSRTFVTSSTNQQMSERFLYVLFVWTILGSRHRIATESRFSFSSLPYVIITQSGSAALASFFYYPFSRSNSP